MSPEPVLTPEVAALCRAVADRGAGMLCDVLRLAVPPRHARVEAEEPRERGTARRLRAGSGRVGAATGTAPRCSTRSARPGPRTRCGRRCRGRSGRPASPRPRRPPWRPGGARWSWCPTSATSRVLLDACAALVGADAVVALSADLGPAERYRRWLAVRRGAVPVGDRHPGDRVRAGRASSGSSPSGTTATTRTPNRAPRTRTSATCWCCARTPAAPRCWSVGTRARRRGSCWSSRAGPARWWPSAAAVRAAMPRIVAIGETTAQQDRDPALRAARLPARGVRGGPRARWTPAARCSCRCRAPATCRGWPAPVPRAGALPALRRPARPARRCAAEDAAALPHCRWCGRAGAGVPVRELRCAPAAGGGGRVRAHRGGAGPGVPRGAGAVVRRRGRRCSTPADARPELVVATPGAEPRVDGGYGAALLLDGWALLARADLRVGGGDAAPLDGRRGLVVPHGDGGRVVVMAPSDCRSVQALVRWDPAGTPRPSSRRAPRSGSRRRCAWPRCEGHAGRRGGRARRRRGAARRRRGGARTGGGRAGARRRGGRRSGSARCCGCAAPTAGRSPRRCTPRRRPAPPARPPTWCGCSWIRLRSGDPSAGMRPRPSSRTG